MGSFGGFLVLKLIELKLILILIDAYGDASSWRDLWRLFAAQSELAQIGTVTSIVSIIAILAVTLRRIVAEFVALRRQLQRRTDHDSMTDLAPGD